MNVCFFGYGSSYNTNTQHYIDKIWNVHDKYDKIIEQSSDKCYIAGLIVHLLLSGNDVSKENLELCKMTHQKELNFLQNNNHSIILDQKIVWLDKKRRIECILKELDMIRNIIIKK